MQGTRFKAIISFAFCDFLSVSIVCPVVSIFAYKGCASVFQVHQGIFQVLKALQAPSESRIMLFGPTCPVNHLKKYCQVKEGHRLFDISADELRSDFKTAFKRTGLPARLTPHSLRVSGATWAKKSGWSEEQIRVRGHWHQMCIRSM